MSRIKSDWKYYVPDQGETVDEASPIPLYEWQRIFYAEDAARFAAADEWDSRGGNKRGFGDGVRIVVVSPKGRETAFMCEAEADVNHCVREVE